MKLFEPITIRGMELKNRIMMLSMGGLVGYSGRASRAWYVERARGGAAAIITSGTLPDLLISDDAWGQPGSADAFVDGLHRLTDDVHEAGVKMGMQIWHGNFLRAGAGYFGAATQEQAATGGDAVAPSPGEGMREITVAEIESIIAHYAAAAARIREAGFDFVEVHGAHGYLLCQFFSPLENRRSDKYGGNLGGRMRFGIECMRAIRQAVGNDFPIFFRIGARDARPGGTTLEDAIAYAREMEKAGADAFDVSVACVNKLGRGAIAFSPGRKEPVATFVPLAEAIKKNVSVPVIGVGCINTPELAEDILLKGRADLIGLGRQLIADPFWPKKVFEGRTNEIMSCDYCNANCFSFVPGRPKLKPSASLCRVNPRAGHESETPPPE